MEVALGTRFGIAAAMGAPCPGAACCCGSGWPDASNCGCALAAACDDIDVVILDVQLPDTTGFEVSRRLAREGFSGRIVLVSSRAASEYGELVSDSGAIGFIAKDQLSGAALARLLEQGDVHAHCAE